MNLFTARYILLSKEYFSTSNMHISHLENELKCKF